MRPATKRCSKCHEHRGIDDFSYDERTKDKLSFQCYYCRRARYLDRMQNRTPEERLIYKIRSAVNSNNSRARSLGLPARLTFAEWKYLMDKSGGICLRCERYVGLEKLTLDHIIPLSAGGGTVLENVEPVCKSCNSSKCNRVTP